MDAIPANQKFIDTLFIEGVWHEQGVSIVLAPLMGHTLHISGIDESVMRTLALLSSEQHVSIEEVVRQYLRSLALPLQSIDPNAVRERDSTVRSLLGMWNPDEAHEFEQNTAPLREIDASLWQ